MQAGITIQSWKLPSDFLCQHSNYNTNRNHKILKLSLDLYLHNNTLKWAYFGSGACAYKNTTWVASQQLGGGT